EDFEDYFLQTQIPEGAGGGQLNHAAQEIPSISTVSTTKKVEWIRYLNNNSGGAIDINEVALVSDMKALFGTVIAIGKILMSRDHLASTVTVPSTGQLKVIYTIQLTYPS
ncbi:unnamed protein product, partial [marine sediment metagenome]